MRNLARLYLLLSCVVRCLRRPGILAIVYGIQAEVSSLSIVVHLCVHKLPKQLLISIVCGLFVSVENKTSSPAHSFKTGLLVYI